MSEKGLMLNFDNSHFFGSRKIGEAVQDVIPYIAQYSGTQAGAIAFNVNAMRADYNSKVMEPFWTGYDPDRGFVNPYTSEAVETPEWTRIWAHNAKELCSGDRDVFHTWLEECRKTGISPWISVRMNDVHNVDQSYSPLLSSFWLEHPEYRRVPYRFKEWPDRALDFGRAEVRSYMRNFIDEVIDRYDMDGLELDWMRFGFHFRPGFEAEGAGILTEFTREVRERLRKAEKERGRRIQLSARVPSTPDTALGLGMDAVTWARQGLVDLLVITPFWATAETDMPVKLWRQLLEGTPVRLAAGLEVLLRPYPGEPSPRRTNSIETVRGMAWSYLSRGIDLIYLFNYFDRVTAMDDLENYPALLREAGSLETLKGKRRRHVVTYQDTWAPGIPAGYLLPAVLSRNDWKAFRIHVGSAPGEERVHAVIGIKEGGNFPEVYVNGVRCENRTEAGKTPPLPQGPVLAYEIKSGVLHDGHNLVEATGADCEIIWVEINVEEALWIK
jgi:hypothetical protein